MTLKPAYIGMCAKGQIVLDFSLLWMMAIITQNKDLNPKIKERNVVTADFTTHGGSHIYGLPCPSVDSLDPMDYFCTFDVSKIIPKNILFSIRNF